MHLWLTFRNLDFNLFDMNRLELDAIPFVIAPSASFL
jgi:hypothetical protein